jgi:hypothetical protein
LNKQKQISLPWRVATKQLFTEILSNDNMGAIKMPLGILYNVMQEVALRAIELNDWQLNILMLRLGLYSIADPDSKDCNLDLASKLIMAQTEAEYKKIVGE